MSKPGTPADSKKPAGAPPAEHAPKPQMAPSGGGKGSVGAKVGCHATTCKEKDTRFNFCEEHFRQFKFGLITKTGERVLDFERKLEHYQLWLKSQGIRSNVA
ncbi:MAG: hypothetical protein HY075_10050 [Deltaproteobacteria bacterium]|nr:hypothetical protein [Deltaproteobacteria bacterium]